MNSRSSFYQSVVAALSGFRSAISQRNFLIQCFCGLSVLALLFLLRPALIWWAVTFQMVGMVLGFELFNTALESLSDIVEPRFHPLIKKTKDCAAAAVLINAAISLLLLGLLLGDFIKRS